MYFIFAENGTIWMFCFHCGICALQTHKRKRPSQVQRYIQACEAALPGHGDIIQPLGLTLSSS